MSQPNPIKWSSIPGVALGDIPRVDIPGAQSAASGEAVDAGGGVPLALFSPLNMPRTPAGLPNWFRKLESDPANAKIVLLGDSTSVEANDAQLYGRLRGVHATGGGGLAGMTGDAAHIINGGNNGLSLAGWLSNHSGATGYNFNQLVADAPDLIVFSFGINDLRTITDQSVAAMTAVLSPLLAQAINAILAALPHSDIVLRVPNGATTDDVAAQHFIQGPVGTNNPAGGAQRFTTALRNAYVAQRDLWPNVIVWDAQERIFGKLALTSAQTTLWANQIHPSATGYNAIADDLVADAIGRPAINPTTVPNDSEAGGATVGIIATTTTPWTLDPTAVEDPAHFLLISPPNGYKGTGTLTAGAGQVLPFGPIAGNAIIGRGGDILQVSYPGGKVCIQLSGNAVTTPASGGPIKNIQYTVTIPAALDGVNTYRVRVYREFDQGDALFGAIRAAGHAQNQMCKVGRIAGGGAGFIVINPEPDGSLPDTASWPVDRANDLLHIANSGANPISLAAATIQTSGTHLQITGLGAINGNTLAGHLCMIVGAHPEETTGGDHLINQNLNIGIVTAGAVKIVTFAYAGARQRGSYNTLLAQRRGALPAGIYQLREYVNADDQGAIPFWNQTGADIDAGIVPYDYWLVR